MQIQTLDFFYFNETVWNGLRMEVGLLLSRTRRTRKFHCEYSVLCYHFNETKSIYNPLLWRYGAHLHNFEPRICYTFGFLVCSTPPLKSHHKLGRPEVESGAS
jgi:hypothetical protein